MFFLNSITNPIICFFHITHLYIGFYSINSTKNLCIYFSGLVKLLFWRWTVEILIGFKHHWRYTETRPRSHLFRRIGGKHKGKFYTHSRFPFWSFCSHKNFLLVVITGKLYDFYDPKTLIHICIPMTSENW